MDSNPHLVSGSGSRSEPESDRGFLQQSFSGYPPQFSSSLLNPTYYMDPVTGRYDYRQRHSLQDRGQFGSYLNPNYYPNPVGGGQFSSFTPNYYYMKKSATIPSTFYLDPNESGSYGYSNYYYNDFNPMLRVERDNVADSTAERPPSPPPPPAPEERSGWDFFNIFGNYEQFLINSMGRLGSGSGSFSSPDSSEIREKEGIPDLEEETEPESFREGEKKRKEVVGAGIGSSTVAPLEEVVEEKISTVKDEKDGEKFHVAEEEEKFVRKKGVSFEGEGSLKTDENGLGSSLSSLATEESRSGDGIDALHVHPLKDVVEAVEEIKQQFKSAAGCGEEAAKLLEVGKLPYRSRSTPLRGGYCIVSS